MPATAITDMIAEAVNLIVHLRLDTASGRRVVSSIYEVAGLEGEAITGSEIFGWHDGALVWTGIRPRCAARLAASGMPWSGASGGDGR